MGSVPSAAATESAALAARVTAQFAESAKLTHVHLQSEAPQAFHVGRILVRQAANSEYRSHNLQAGGAAVYRSVRLFCYVLDKSS